MTDEERNRELTRSSFAAQMAMLGYEPNGNPKDMVERPKAVKPICKIIFDVPYYFCGDCKAMLNMYSTKAKFCSQCGQIVQWE